MPFGGSSFKPTKPFHWIKPPKLAIAAPPNNKEKEIFLVSGEMVFWSWSGYTLAVFFGRLILCFLIAKTLVKSCIGQPLMVEEVRVLMSVKESFIDPLNATSDWEKSYTDPCSWHYVTCSGDLTAVIRLELGNLQLSGAISSEISKLHRLETLMLEDNNITGAIPTELGLLTNLNTLDVSNNQLTGRLPTSLGQLKNLHSLRVNNNRFSGPIPTSLASIGALSSVDFSYNNFSGQIPQFSAVSQSAEGNPLLCGLGTDSLCPGQSIPLDASQGVKSMSSRNTVIGVIIAVILLAFLGICIWIWYWRKRRHLRATHDAENYELNTETSLGQLKRYSLQELQQATDDFSVENLLGTGGSGQVYKGCLQDGTMVAVKRLKDRNAVPQFKVELEMISLAAHKNLLRLLGCCTTATELALVYPYMTNGSVASRLREKPPLDWSTRKSIALGSARGLVYLHEQCDPKIIHGDVKATNILLDKEDQAVVADFGLAKFLDHSVSHVKTAVRGTIGYIAPESLSGQISAKTDVYSYGILLLELIAGQTEIGFRRLSGQKLLDWVKKLHEENRLHELVDDEVRRKGYVEQELEKMVRVALLCTLSPYAERPKMSEVLKMLEGEGLEERWEAWQKAEEDRCIAAEQPALDLLCDFSQTMAFQLSGPR